MCRKKRVHFLLEWNCVLASTRSRSFSIFSRATPSKSGATRSPTTKRDIAGLLVSRIESGLDGRNSQPPVIGVPAFCISQCRPQLFDEVSQRVLLLAGRQALEVVPLELPHPIRHAVLALKRGWPVEQLREADFQAMFFEQGRIFAQRGIVGTFFGNLAGVIFGRDFFNGAFEYPNIAVATEFGDEAPALFQRASDAGHYGRPVEH